MSEYYTELSSREATTTRSDGSGWEWDMCHFHPPAKWGAYHVALSECVFMNTHQTINSYNNKISWKLGLDATIYTATLTSGNYSISDLVIHVAAQMTTADGSHTYTGTVSTTTCLVTITIGTATTITLQSIALNCYSELGFENNVGVATASTALLGADQYDTDGPASIMVVSSIGGVNNVSRMGLNVLGTIPLQEGSQHKERYIAQSLQFVPVRHDLNHEFIYLLDSKNYNPYQLSRITDFRIKLIYRAINSEQVSDSGPSKKRHRN